MKKVFLYLLLVFMLTGCPGANIGLGSWQTAMVNGKQQGFRPGGTEQQLSYQPGLQPTYG